MKSIITVITVALILGLSDILISNIYLRNTSHQKVLAQNTVQMPSPTPSPESTPTPSPSPSPVYTGFCLNVPILLYHHIQPNEQAKQKGQTALSVDSQIFDSQMSYLASSAYSTITVDQIAQALKNHQQLPPKSIIITMDDGYQDQFTYAFPIIQKYHLTVNLMIPTGLLNNPDYMSWDQLKQMSGSGLAHAYDHTYSHANLGAVDAEKLKFEVMTGKKQLEEKLGKPINIFAYPYGSENNTVINFLTTNGFIAALSTIPGQIQCDSFIMSLHRTRIGNSSIRAYGL